jgi:hypothetical protein
LPRFGVEHRGERVDAGRLLDVPRRHLVGELDRLVAGAAEGGRIDQRRGHEPLEVLDVLGGAGQDRVAGRRRRVRRGAADLEEGDRIVGGKARAEVEGRCERVPDEREDVAGAAGRIDEDVGPLARPEVDLALVEAGLQHVLGAALEDDVVEQPALAADAVELVVAAVGQLEPEVPRDALVQQPQPDAAAGRDREQRRVRRGVRSLPVHEHGRPGLPGGVAGRLDSARVADLDEVAELDQLVLRLGHAAERLADDARGVELDVAHRERERGGVRGQRRALQAGLDVVLDDDHAVQAGEERVARQHVRVEPEDARPEGLELVRVALPRQHRVLRDRRAVAVVVELEAVPVDAGALDRQLVLEAADDHVAHLDLDDQDRHPGAHGDGRGGLVAVDHGMDRGAGDGHVLLDGGQVALEDVRSRIGIRDREDVGPRRRDDGQHNERRRAHPRVLPMSSHGLPPDGVAAAFSASIKVSIAGLSW